MGQYERRKEDGIEIDGRSTVRGKEEGRWSVKEDGTTWKMEKDRRKKMEDR